MRPHGSAEGSAVTLNAMLCESVMQAADEFLIVGGVRTTFTASGSPLRIAGIGVAAHMHVTSDASSRPHTLQVSLEDGSRTPLPLVAAPSTSSGVPHYIIEAALDVVDRVPAGGQTLRVPWCTNIRNLVVPAPGHYELVLSVDDVEARRLPFEVRRRDERRA